MTFKKRIIKKKIRKPQPKVRDFNPFRDWVEDQFVQPQDINREVFGQ